MEGILWSAAERNLKHGYFTDVYFKSLSIHINLEIFFVNKEIEIIIYKFYQFLYVSYFQILIMYLKFFSTKKDPLKIKVEKYLTSCFGNLLIKTLHILHVACSGRCNPDVQ